MTAPVLFSTGAPTTSSGSRNLVEFKAGKMEMRDKMVHPVKRQGVVYLHQSVDDSLMHFCWKDRQTGVVEDDLILFPDDCEFKRVKECTTGRVYVLRMKSSNRKLFFWMQEAKTDRDEEYCKKINDMLNNPPRGGSDHGSGSGGGSSSERELQALFGNMTQEQVAQLLSSNGITGFASLLNSASGRSPSSNSGASASSAASTAGSSAPTSASASNPQAATAAGRESSPNMNDLGALLTNALMERNDDEALMLAHQLSEGRQRQPQSQQSQGPLVDLATAVNSDSLAHLLSDEEFMRQVQPHLPPVSQTADTTGLSTNELRVQFGDTIRSSQFQSSLSQFCVALQSGQLGPLLSQFGLNQACVDAAHSGNLEAFVKALEDQMKGDQPDTPKTGKPPSQDGSGGSSNPDPSSAS